MNLCTEITVKTEPPVLINRKAKTFCPRCEREMISPNQAVQLIGCNPGAIWGWIQLGWLHSTETKDGLLQVCSQSLGEIIKIN